MGIENDVLDLLMSSMMMDDDDIFPLGDHTGADDQRRRESNQSFCFARTTPSGFFLTMIL